MSRALALVALTHLRYMHSEHPFMLELASSPLVNVKLPCSLPRTIQAFGRLARKGGCTSSAAGGIVGSSSARCRASTGCVLWAWAASEPLLRQRNIDFHAPPCKRCWCCVLVAARGSTLSGPHAGCTQGVSMVGSSGVAYSAHSTRIKRVCIMPLRYSEARWTQRWHDLQRRCLDRL